MNEARQGKVEGGDEIDHLLLDLAYAKLGRTEDNITDHQDIVFVWISVFFSFFIFQYCPFTVLQYRACCCRYSIPSETSCETF